ncbi:DUF742 domain-containing protein [Streptomyces sp. TS71-3]|uniref:DUF742 domain-containing protein n=1 Tax=Streptomyces sp. TS71-3 TaxID=2733862 RepID=UPI001B01DBED|nr:DUF742 domain-containing protein [Streptomyces sp. TS71-3]GHJ42061.1 hypothetical protein Sm713_76700 [Streptomyces sp. TS71-3]
MPDRQWPEPEGVGHHVRPYAITGGRTRHSEHSFSLITLVVTRSPDGFGGEPVEPEAAAILDICRDRAVAIAEIAAQLDLPVSVVKVLCGDLLNSELVLVQAPPKEGDAPSVDLIERVMDGIRRL